MQLNPRLLVNLLVKLTKNEYPNGGHGGAPPLPSSSVQFGSGEYTRERLVRSGIGESLGQPPNSEFRKVYWLMRLMRLMRLE